MAHPPLQPELSASPQFNLKSSHVKGVKTKFCPWCLVWRQKPRAVRLIYTKSNIIIVPKVSPRATAQHTDDQRSLRSRPTSSQLNFQRCPSGGDLHSEPLREGGHGHGQPTGGGSTSEDRRSSSVLRADSASGLKASGDLTLASIICMAMRVRACAKRTTIGAQEYATVEHTPTALADSCSTLHTHSPTR